MTTGIWVQRGSALIRRQTSKPVIPGIITSSSTMSGGSLSIAASADGPSSAVITSKYSAVSLACNRDRQQSRVRLFELGRVFHADGVGETRRDRKRTRLNSSH